MDARTVHRRRWATLGVLCLSLVIIGLDNTVLNVALPTLEKSLGASFSGLQWIVDAYTLVFAGLLLTAGSLADRFGRKRALTAGLVVFAGASLGAAWASSSGELIAARSLMGLAAAFIMPATLSILTFVFRDPAERAKAIGIWAAVAGLGIVVGPTLGGWLLEHFWWGSVFLVNVPVAVGALVAGVSLVPESRDPAAPRIDVGGAVLSTAGLVSLVWAIIEAPSHGWTARSVLLAFALAGALLGAFAVCELRVAEPMLDLRFFRDRRFSTAALSITLVFFALFGSVFFLTQYLQFVLGYAPLPAGIRILPIASMVLAAPLGMQLVSRVGTKLVVAGGMATLAGALLLLSRTSIADGYGHLAVVIVLLGAGMGLTMAPATDAVMASLPSGKAGVGSAVNDAVRQVGGALGVAVLGSLLSSAYSSALPPVVRGVPVPEQARDGLGGSLAVAGHLPAEAGRELMNAAGRAYVHAMDRGVLVGAGVALAGALVALVWMPAKGRAPEVEDASAAVRKEVVAVPAGC